VDFLKILHLTSYRHGFYKHRGFREKREGFPKPLTLLLTVTAFTSTLVQREKKELKNKK